MDPWTFRRISVRFLENDQAYDVIGRVLHRDRDQVTLMRRDGQTRTITVGAIIAAREVPETSAPLRPALSFPREDLIAVTNLGRVEPLPGRYRLLVLDLSHGGETVDLDPSPDDRWWDSQHRTGSLTVDDVSAPLCGFLSRADLAARVLVNGDWMTVDALALAEPTSLATLDELLPSLQAWAHHRGARHAWAVVEDESDLLALYTRHGYLEHHRGEG